MFGVGLKNTKEDLIRANGRSEAKAGRNKARHDKITRRAKDLFLAGRVIQDLARAS